MKRTVLMVLACLSLTGAAAAQSAGQKTNGQVPTLRSIDLPKIEVEMKEGEGRSAAATYCNICHSTDYITMQPPLSKAQWTATVNKMVKTFGAPIGPDDVNKIINYLTNNYGNGR